MRPDYVLETGTDKWLGSCALAAALLRNGGGRLITVDLNPTAGALISGSYAAVTTLLTGDSLAAIGGLSHTVDLFPHDTDHTPEHETAELEAVAAHLTTRPLVLSDNSHWSPSLPQWAESTGRRLLYFDERPVGHWYPGAGIGAAFFVHPDPV